MSTYHLPQQQRLATKPHPAAAKVVPWRNFASKANHKSDRTSSAKGLEARQGRQSVQAVQDEDDDDDDDAAADVARRQAAKIYSKFKMASVKLFQYS